MLVFAMDTTSVNAAVALLNDDKLVGEYMISNLKTHSQMIMPMMDSLIKNSGLTLNDIDVFSVCTGPGSFTGVRIGMAAVKTICQVQKKPIIGISSLDSLAANIIADDTYICPIIDARHGEVYNAVYYNDDKICENRVIKIDEIIDELHGKKTIFVGDGVISYRDKITEEPNHNIAPQSFNTQKASSVAYLAFERAIKEDFDNLYSLLPVYLRKSQAEREYEKNHKQI